MCAIIYEYVYTKAKPSLYELRVAKKLVKGALNLQDLRSLIIFIYIIYLYTILLWFRPPGLKSIYLLWEHHTKCREGGMLFDALLWAVNWWAGSALYISYGCRGLWPLTGGGPVFSVTILADWLILISPTDWLSWWTCKSLISWEYTINGIFILCEANKSTWKYKSNIRFLKYF